MPVHSIPHWVLPACLGCPMTASLQLLLPPSFLVFLRTKKKKLLGNSIAIPIQRENTCNSEYPALNISIPAQPPPHMPPATTRLPSATVLLLLCHVFLGHLIVILLTKTPIQAPAENTSGAAERADALTWRWTTPHAALFRRLSSRGSPSLPAQFLFIFLCRVTALHAYSGAKTGAAATPELSGLALYAWLRSIRRRALYSGRLYS